MLSITAQAILMRLLDSPGSLVIFEDKKVKFGRRLKQMRTYNASQIIAKILHFENNKIHVDELKG